MVTVTATDVTELSGDQRFRVLVPNRAPVAVGEIESREMPVGETASVDVSAHFREPDGQPLSYGMSVSGEGVVTISAAGSVVTLVAEAKGSATVTATATDPGGLSATQSFVVTVPNRSPAAAGSIPPQTIEVDASATTDVTAYFTDPDGDDLTYAAISSDAAVAEVSVEGGDLTVAAVRQGRGDGVGDGHGHGGAHGHAGVPGDRAEPATGGGADDRWAYHRGGRGRHAGTVRVLR